MFNSTTINLVSLSLNKNITYPLYSLTAIFEQCNDNGLIEEITIPKIELPCNALNIIIQRDTVSDTDIINLGFGALEILPDKNGKKFITKVIKPVDTKELTMAKLKRNLDIQ